MAAISNADLRKHLDRRLGGLGNIRKPYEQHAADVARFCQPRLSPFLVQMGRRGNSREQRSRGNNSLYNGAAVVAFRTLTNGMAAGLSSPSQPWFRLRPDDPELAEAAGVKEWLDDVEERIYGFLASTTIYTTLQSCYRELGLFGTNAGLIVPHWRHGAATFGFTFGEYLIGQDDAGRVDTLARDATMTVAQVYERFEERTISRTVKTLHSENKYDALVPVWHLIEPNRERAYGKIDKTNMPFRSVYWEPGNDVQSDVLSFGGFEDQPFWASRWDVLGNEVYGTGAGFDCLPDSRKLQLQELRLQGAHDYTVHPALMAPPSLRNTGASLVPKGITYVAGQDANAPIRPIWEMNPAAIPHIAADIGRTEDAIRSATYADLFMAITNMRGVQPRNMEEIARRHEEQLSQLGPVVDRVQVEMLGPIVLQAFRILSKAGMIPPVPDDLNGKPLNIEFVSILAQAQRMVGLGNMERLMGFVGNLAGAVPSVLDKIDADQAVDEYSARLGTPARVVRPDQAVSDLREARQQQEQMAQLQAMAPAAKDGATAAAVLAKADASGQAPLDRLLSGV